MYKIKRSEVKQMALNEFGSISIESQNKVLIKISTTMCARVSYTVVGDEKEITPRDLIKVYDEKLIDQDPPHSSPFEHCARVMSDEEYHEFNRGKAKAYGYGVLDFSNNSQGWCNNFKGFIQLRYLIEKENFKL